MLLGYPVTDNDGITPYTSRIGGAPMWAKPVDNVFSNIQCLTCHRKLSFVAQVYAPTHLERVLFIFGCNDSKCSKSPKGWKVIRLQHEMEREIRHQQPEDKSTKVLLDSLNWDDSSEEEETDCDTSNIEDLMARRNAALETTPVTFKNHPVVSYKSYAEYQTFKSVKLQVEEEPVEVASSDKYAMRLYAEYLEREKEEATVEKKDKSTSFCAESYERTPASEKTFQKFQKRVARMPSQVLRYNYGGKPLAMNALKSTLCKNSCVCGKERVFEMQLMPSLLFVLDVDPNSGMDWGTIDVYSCPDSCPNSFTEAVLVEDSMK